MVRFQIVDLAADAAIVAPLHRSARIGRAVVSDRIVPKSLLLAELRTFEFVPLVVGQRIAVGILHHPDDARFGRSFEGVARNREIVAAAITLRRIVDAVVEPDDDVAAPAAERHPRPLAQPFFGIGDGRFGRGLRTGEPSRNEFIDELAGRRRIFVDLRPRRFAGRRGRTSESPLFVAAFDAVLHRRSHLAGRPHPFRHRRRRFVRAVRHREKQLLHSFAGRRIGAGELRRDLLAVDRPAVTGIPAVPNRGTQRDRPPERHGTCQPVVKPSDRRHRHRDRKRLGHLHADALLVGPVLVLGPQAEFVFAQRLFAELVSLLAPDLLRLGSPRTTHRPAVGRLLAPPHVRRDLVDMPPHDLRPFGEDDHGRQDSVNLHARLFARRPLGRGHLQLDVIILLLLALHLVDDVGQHGFGRDDPARLLQLPRIDRTVDVLISRGDGKLPPHLGGVDACIDIEGDDRSLRLLARDDVVLVAGDGRRGKERKTTETYSVHGLSVFNANRRRRG